MDGLRYVETTFAQSIAHLPTRYMPPGSIKMLYYQFSQQHAGISCLVLPCLLSFSRSSQFLPVSDDFVSLLGIARYSTFYRRYKAAWQNTLRFLTPTSHAACDACMDYKEAFRVATDACLFLHCCICAYQGLANPLFCSEALQSAPGGGAERSASGRISAGEIASPSGSLAC